jgi:TPR repeat protein
MIELGYIYLYGRYGMKTNLSEAVTWFGSAAKLGWADAEYHLVSCNTLYFVY